MTNKYKISVIKHKIVSSEREIKGYDVYTFYTKTEVGAIDRAYTIASNYSPCNIKKSLNGYYNIPLEGYLCKKIEISVKLI